MQATVFGRLHANVRPRGTKILRATPKSSARHQHPPRGTNTLRAAPQRYSVKDDRPLPRFCHPRVRPLWCMEPAIKSRRAAKRGEMHQRGLTPSSHSEPAQSPRHPLRREHHPRLLVTEHHLAAQDGRDRYAELFERELDRLDAVIAELAEWRRDGQSVLLGDHCLFLDEQCRHARVARIRIGVGLHEQCDQGGAVTVGDPHLVAVDDELVAFASGNRANRLDVRAGIGLGHREARANLADRESR